MSRQFRRLGLVGLGHIGKVYFSAINLSPDIELTALCDINPDLLDDYQSQTTKYTCLKSFLSDPAFDTVVIATPVSSHAVIARQAIENNKNIILEKPATASLDELISIIHLAKKNSVNIYFAFHASFGLETLWYFNHQKLESCATITSFRSRFCDPYLTNKDTIVKNAKNLENPWTDSGINALSVLSRFFDMSKFSFTHQSESRPFVKSISMMNVHDFLFQTGSTDAFSGCGSITTSWQASSSQKSTYLYYGESNTCIHLDHTAQAVYKISGSIEENLFQASGSRLLNHYLGIFEDIRYVDAVKLNGNHKLGLQLHRLLFAHQSS